jgi:hypothetical protein
MSNEAVSFRVETRIVVGVAPLKSERPFHDDRIGVVHSMLGDTIRTIVFVPEELRELADG